MTPGARGGKAASADDDHVWYACYGSNMNFERFMCYLRGGTPAGASREHPPCENPSEPTDSQPIQLPYPLCFAHTASTWQDGGVCFLALPEAIRTAGLRAKGEVYPDGYPATRRTLARMYRITRQQFGCVLHGENALTGASVDTANIEESLRKRGVADLGEGAVYRLCLSLGAHPRWGHEPIYTFTGTPESVDSPCNPPGEAYLRTVIAGLLETYGQSLGDLELAAYLTDALRTTIDPTKASRAPADRDVLGAIRRVREAVGPPAPEGHDAVVERTTERKGSRREFVARLREHPELADRGPLELEPGDLFVTARAVIDRVHLDLHEDGRPRRYLFVPAASRPRPGEPVGSVAHLRVPAVLLGRGVLDPALPPGDGVGPPTLKGRPVAAHALELDEKIRVGLGVNIGDVVRFAPELGERPEYAARPRGRVWSVGLVGSRLVRRPANWLAGRLEWAVGSQPCLMRVDFATPVDMEIDLCRMGREVFDVIGVNPGDHVKVVSADGVRVGLRAVEMTEAQARRRKTQQERMPQWFQVHLLRADLRRVRRMSTDSELPAVYLDLSARRRLGIDKGEVVRVVRDPLRNLGLRVYLVVVPAAFFIGRAMANGWGPVWGTLAAVALVLAATLVVLWLELRLKIA